jgi:hypothetical protein
MLVPTLWTVIITILLLLTITVFFVNNVAFFLAKQEPVKANILVVEGWLEPAALSQAYAEYKTGHYDLVITTGGPEARNFTDQFDSYAEQAAYQLTLLGISTSNIKVIPTPASAQDRTYLSAVMVRKFIESAPLKYKVKGINVFSGNVHSRRTHFLYKQAFDTLVVPIGIISAFPENFRLENWWQTSAGAKTVLVELIGWIYAHCCFDLPARNSYQEMWGLPRDEAIK